MHVIRFLWCQHSKIFFTIWSGNIGEHGQSIGQNLINIDIPANRIELKVDDATLAERRKHFVPKTKELSGYLKRYAALVSGGASGAVLN